MSVETILKTHPRPLIAELAVLAACIDECGDCAATCTVCSDACLAEDERHTLRNRPVEAGREVVEHNDLFAGRNQRVDHVAADVSGAASDQDRHPIRPSELFQPFPTRICMKNQLLGSLMPFPFR